jgi:uncharacterized protein DUF6178
VAPDDVIPFSRFTALPRQRGLKRVEVLLADKDPVGRVAATPVQELYFLIKDVGLADAYDLVALATPEQFQGFLDLDAWDRDHLEDAAIRPWLTALVDAGEEKLAQVWGSLDPEVTALLFKRWTRVYNLAEEEVPEDESPPFVPTPDGFFLLKITAEDGETVRLVEQLVDRLYRADPELARHTIRTAASEPFAELEEMAYRWRSGRLADLGYAEFHDALGVYLPIDPDAVRIGEGTTDRPWDGVSLPAPLAQPALDQPFLGRVLQQIPSAERSRVVETGLVTLLNRVLSANRVSPGDTDAVAAAAALGAGTLSIGLETVARGDVDRGVEAITTISLSRLHRVGHGVLLKLAKLARALAARARRADDADREILENLLLPRPLRPGLRPFTQVAEVRETTQALARLAAKITYVYDVLRADPEALAPLTTLDDVGRTSVVRYHLDGDGGLASLPLSPGELERFRASPRRPGVREATLARFAERKVEVPQEFSSVLEGWISQLDRLTE